MTTATAPARSKTSAGEIVGLAVVYNVPTTIRTPFGDFDEMIAPTALDAALTGPDAADIALLRDHQSTRLLGRNRSGTLHLLNGVAGLRIRASVPHTELGRETLALVERRDLSGMSFAFAIAQDGSTWHEPKAGGRPLRVVRQIERLYEVSVVTFPAYPSTTVDVAEREFSAHNCRRRSLEAHIAMTGGLVTPGRAVRAPRGLDDWIAFHRWRIGRSASAGPPAGAAEPPRGGGRHSKGA